MFTLFSGEKLRKALWAELVVTMYAAQLNSRVWAAVMINIVVMPHLNFLVCYECRA